MIQKTTSRFSIIFIAFSLAIFGQSALAIHSPDEILKDWKSTSSEEQNYKKFFQALKARDPELFWDLYNSLAKKKKLLKLQHESIKQIVEIDLLTDKDVTRKFKNFSKVAKKC